MMTERDVSTGIKSELCEHDKEAVTVFHRIGRKDKGTLNTLNPISPLIRSFAMPCEQLLSHRHCLLLSHMAIFSV